MGEPYKMTFVNATDQPWFFAVYKSVPESPGLSSVAWQVRGLPQQLQGSKAPQADVTWQMSYGLCIANFDQNFRQYTGSQYGTAVLGQTYQVESKNGIPSIDPNATGTTTSDQIILTNSTSSPVTPVTMGFTLGGNIVVAEQNVGGGQKTIYRVHPTYYVACFHNVVLGELVDESVAIGPVQVSYTGGVHSKTVQASKTLAGDYTLQVS